MFKKLFAFFATMMIAAAAFAAVDVNKATQAELDGIKGIGPVTSRLIMAERNKSEFKNWEDFITRVKGVGDNSAAKFSDSGLTIGGAKYTPTAKTAGASKPLAQKATDAAVATKDAIKGAAIATKDAVKETAKDLKAAVTPASAPVAAKATPAAKSASAAASAAKK